MPLAEQPWRRPLYLAFLATASPLDVDILLMDLVSLRLSQEPCRIDGEGATRGNPGGGETEQHHGENDAREHERVA